MLENMLVQLAAVVNGTALAGLMAARLLNHLESKTRHKAALASGVIKVSPQTTKRAEMNAASRYKIMAGWVEDDKEDAGQLDRILHGGRYLATRNGKAIANPCRIIRFMVEVCGLGAESAENVARSILAEQRSYEVDKEASDKDVAAFILAESVDIFEAIEIARFLYDSHEYRTWSSSFWFGVYYELRAGRISKAAPNRESIKVERNNE